MLDSLIVTPGSSPDLRGRDPRDMSGFPGKDEGKARLVELTAELSSLQERLYAEGKRSVLLVLQGLDASGRTAPSATSSRVSIRKAATSRRSRHRRRMSLPTTSSGVCTPSVPRVE